MEKTERFCHRCVRETRVRLMEREYELIHPLKDASDGREVDRTGSSSFINHTGGPQGRGSTMPLFKSGVIKTWTSSISTRNWLIAVMAKTFKHLPHCTIHNSTTAATSCLVFAANWPTRHLLLYVRIQASSPRLRDFWPMPSLPSVFFNYLFIYSFIILWACVRLCWLVCLFKRGMPGPCQNFLLKSPLCGIFGSAGTEAGSLSLWLGKQRSKCNSSATFSWHVYSCFPEIQSHSLFCNFARKKNPN